MLEDRCLLTLYSVGPGLAFTSLGAVPFENLGPGDTVEVHWQPSAYHEKILISTSGTADQPIRIVGIPGPNGELPVIDGQNATTRSQAGYPFAGTQDRGLVTLTRDNQHLFGFKPSFIDIERLDLRNAHQGFTFTDAQGAVRSYTDNAAAIFVERGEHISVRGCSITGSGNGLFVASGDEEAVVSRAILVEGNRIAGNGNLGSDRFHNVYTAADGIVFQYNFLGDLLPGSFGGGLKDRSAGTVIRYNWIEGGARLLDLVDAEDSPTVLAQEPSYRQAFVYGNVFNDGPEDAGRLIHYGGDSGVTSNYRKGTLYFYDNTVVVRADQLKRFNTTLLELDTNDESVDLRNNVLYTEAATPGATPTDFSLMSSFGNASVGVNWVSPGWQTSTAFGGFQGTITGTENLFGGPANDPGFVNLSGNDFHLSSNSPAVDRGGPLAPSAVGTNDVLRQYVAPQSSAPRQVNGAASDLGAFEANGSAAPSPGQLQFSSAAYSVAENGGSATITVNRTGGSDGTVAVQVNITGDTASGADFTPPASSTLSFGPGVTSRSLSIAVLDDNLVEGSETVSLALQNVTGGAALAAPITAVLTITDDDGASNPGQLQFSSAAYSTAEGAGSAAVTVTRTGGSDGTVTVLVGVSGGSATSGTDYTPPASPTLLFGPGVTSQTLSIPVLDDNLVEGDETVDLALQNVTGGATLASPATAVLTITDNDAAPNPGQFGRLQFSSAAYSVVEGAGSASLTVTRTGGSDGTVAVQYAVSVPDDLGTEGRATPGQDFTGPLTGTITFAPGETTKTLMIPVADDNLVEDTEFFSVTLQGPAGGATLGSPGRATVGIQDDDLPQVSDATPKLSTLQTAGSGFGKSEEHYRDFVTKAYSRYLNRLPDAQGFAFWVGLMQLYETSGHAQGLRQEQIEAGFLDSSEYLGRNGGIAGAGTPAQPETWVRAIYRDLLSRGADPTGLQFWLSALQAGASPKDVALGFTASLERLRNRVTDTYFTLLGRAPDDFGLGYWVAVFQQGGTTEDINSGFVGSVEYYAKPGGAAGNPARWVREAYLDILFRPARTDELAFWLEVLKL